ncbi:hypothetical protein BGP77_00865 [Saccharospirillum sp. MSK14-1]|uniref:substrate-binding periplasmic protein n=1 Tax=Saccharospirillum sp. MSK14-1 TaxID=1897632 RepID=UPI000D4CE8F1|nr:transporter substrate-binding domain-containing protein [Saccharospirillum sp. MSK14-1]PTY35911.1 hypothetical protein BGP77_00865 [Saccharospirillum sp. MSK14-1]
MFADPLTVITLSNSVYNEVGIPLITELYQSAGAEVTLLAIPAPRQAFILAQESADAIIVSPLGLNQRNPSYLRLPTVISSVRLMLFTGRNDLSWPLHDDLTMGVLRGIVPSDARDKLPAGLTLVEVNDLSQMMRMADRQRVDVVLMPYTQGLATIRDLQLQRVRPLGPALSDVPMYHYIHKRHQNLVAPLSATLEQWSESGYLQERHRQWWEPLEARVNQR